MFATGKMGSLLVLLTASFSTHRTMTPQILPWGGAGLLSSPESDSYI